MLAREWLDISLEQCLSGSSDLYAISSRALESLSRAHVRVQGIHINELKGTFKRPSKGPGKVHVDSASRDRGATVRVSAAVQSYLGSRRLWLV